MYTWPSAVALNPALRRPPSSSLGFTVAFSDRHTPANTAPPHIPARASFWYVRPPSLPQPPLFRAHMKMSLAKPFPSHIQENAHVSEPPAPAGREGRGGSQRRSRPSAPQRPTPPPQGKRHQNKRRGRHTGGRADWLGLGERGGVGWSCFADWLQSGAGRGDRADWLRRGEDRGWQPLARGLKMATAARGALGAADGSGSSVSRSVNSAPPDAVEAVAAEWMLEFACSSLCRHFEEQSGAQFWRWRDVAQGEPPRSRSRGIEP